MQLKWEFMVQGGENTEVKTIDFVEEGYSKYRIGG